MLPLVGIPSTIQNALDAYRPVFCREAGVGHISRYISGLLLSPNKTLQGIYSQWVWPEGEAVSRRAMQASVFESGWQIDELMRTHRQVVAPSHQGKGRAVLSLDWTFAHHPYSHKIFAVKAAYDYVNRCWSRYQTVVTAAIANPHRVDGVAVDVQFPNYAKEELAYLEMPAQASYEQMEPVYRPRRPAALPEELKTARRSYASLKRDGVFRQVAASKAGLGAIAAYQPGFRLR